MQTQTSQPAHPGLDGVVAARTRLSNVDGEAGRLTIAGYAVEEIAPHLSFEEMLCLLWTDHLPPAAERDRMADDLRAGALLPTPVLDSLRQAAAKECSPMHAMRAAVGALGLDSPTREQVVGALSAIVAAYARIRAGKEPLAPDSQSGFAANHLFLLRGELAPEREARALETYLNTVIDHGMNASTFTARVIASTGSDFVAAVEGAIGALQGPLHGGAPGPALESLMELRGEGDGTLSERTRAWARRTIDEGGRIMGFGHRVYKVRDPRADVLLAAAEDLLQGSGLYEDAGVFERAVLEVLEEKKPGRRLKTNVEFATALLLHGIGIEPEYFSATFAMSRVGGWIAHFLEQQSEGRL
ncbi:MAG: citrate/2-methylcitrate synthase, partial [Planctomycetota bacterium]